jgi:hypothetical protein
MNTIEFIKGEDAIRLKGNTPFSVNYTMVIENGPGSYIIEIPSFNIFFETDSEDKIVGVAERSFESFLGYWLQEKGLNSFKNHMKALGFTQKQRSKNRKSEPSVLKEVKTISRQNMVFCV